MSYPKLVRDNIIDIIRQDNKKPIFHVATDEEYRAALLAKLHEEIAEFTADQNTEELADILEVLQAICSEYSIEWKSVETIAAKKREQRGGFAKKIILEQINEIR